MRKLIHVLDRISLVLALASGVVLIGLVFLTFFDVTLRYLFSSPITGAQDLIAMGMVIVFFFALKPTRKNILGILIGFLGAVYLTVSNWNTEIIINSYVFYIVLATLFYAISINVIKHYLDELDPIYISALAFLFVGPPMGIYIFNTDFTSYGFLIVILLHMDFKP